MNIRIALAIFLGAFALAILGSVAGPFLDSDGSLSALTFGPLGLNAVKVISFSLFCLIGFSFIPLVIRLFISLQIRIGNGEFFLIKFFQKHEKALVYAAWIMMLFGFTLIFALGGEETLNDFR
jgi:hypothetical protein